MNELLLLENQLCFRLYSVSRKMTKAYQPYLQEYGITYPQYVVLLVLFEHESMDFKDLSDQVQLKTGTLTPILQNLEKLGYILRLPNEKDKRRLDVSLSEKGKELKQKIISVPLGLAERLKVSIEMYEKLVRELDELSDMLDQTLESQEGVK